MTKTRRILVKKGTYRDSITLMRISNNLTTMKGVTQGAVVIATPLNKKLLADVGFKDRQIDSSGTDDLIIAIEAEDAATLDGAIAEAQRLLNSSIVGTQAEHLPKTISEALSQMPDSNLVVISVPGQFAAREARHALDRDLNVFLFSSNVSREDERELKEMAKKKNLLVMGPDCGTAIINHTVIGFGNVVRSGSVGLVSASGTGLQEVSTMIHQAGLGISQAIGTGGGDLSDEVGGITMLQGLKILEDDEQTHVIVLISKPPDPTTTDLVLEAVRECRKPVVVNFLGSSIEPARLGGQSCAGTLEEAARRTCELAGKDTSTLWKGNAEGAVRSESAKLAKSQKFVRGLYSGGTLCYEAQVVFRPLLGKVFSNGPLDPDLKVDGDTPSRGHTCIDMGAEEFVVGRAHPMIDFTLRNRRILQEAKDPEIAVLLLDIELGYGSNPDPAGELVPVVKEAKEIARRAGRYLPFVASMVGTDGDFQGLAAQEDRLRRAGVILLPSNVQAAEVAAMIAIRRVA